MKTFNGFPPGKVRMTPLPAQFFSDLLPLVDDLAELKVTLFCFWALQQQEGDFRYLRREDFVAGESLMRGLATIDPDTPPETMLDGALARATERGTLLRAAVDLDSGTEYLYFVNTGRGRTAIQQIDAGHWQLGTADTPVEILPERPNIYALYEANIGPLTPLIADALKDAENEYPAAWLEEAITVAVENNVRRWSYIRTILERWDKEGKNRDEIAGRHTRKRYTTGKYADFIQS